MDRDYSMKLEFKELFTKEEASFFNVFILIYFEYPLIF